MEQQPILPIKLPRDDIVDKAAVVIEVQDRLNKLLDSHAIVNEESEQSSELLSIYKIPHFMRENSPKAFEPQLVSFGPYHHGKPHLLPMELEKLKVLHRFKANYGLYVESIVNSVSTILEDLRRSYNKLEEEWTEGKFLELMIVDGCFMLEFLNEKCPTSQNNMSGNIKRDMLLLENQLPMKLLDQLYSIAHQNQPLSKDLKSLICDSLCISGDGLVAEYMHILEMYKASLLYPPIDRKDRSGKAEYKQSDPECQIIRPATRLREAGIKFEKNKKNNSLADVSFDQKRGVLRLPQLVVDDDTESNFLNVMAFEKLHFDAGSKVTSFVILMNNLIDDDRDVALLASEKILMNALGNDKDAADLFNRLGNGVALDLDSHMVRVHRLVNEHCSKTWNEWCASLKHDYFQNPWAIISIFAAMLGFVLLILQALYQLFDYYLKV